jgi:hypothetical protein
MWRACRAANGDLRAIKRVDKSGNIDRGHLGRWCRYVCKPCHPILHDREPVGAFGLGLAKVAAELRKVA